MGKADCQAGCSLSCLTCRRRSGTFPSGRCAGTSLSPMSDSMTRTSAVEQNAGTSWAVIFFASSLKSSVSSSTGLRVAQQDVPHQGGVDEPFRGRDRDLHDHEGGDVARSGLHRLGGDHGVGAQPARQRDGQHGVALAIRPHRVEQHR